MTYHLQIVTPDGIRFDAEAERLLVPAAEGDAMIMARHVNFVTSLRLGLVKVTTEAGERRAACMGGMLAVTDGAVTLVTPAFEWADTIDPVRAAESQHRAEALLASDIDDQTRAAAQARLNRAKLRLALAGKKE